MQKIVIATVLTLLFLVLPAYTENASPPDKYTPAVVRVAFDYSLDIQEKLTVQDGVVHSGIPKLDRVLEEIEAYDWEPLLGSLGRFEEKWAHWSNRVVFHFPDRFDAAEVAKRFEKLPFVKYSLPDYIIPPLYLPVTPDDPGYSRQWWAPKIGLDRAWGTTTGNSSIIMTGIDSGVNWSHPDLYPNIWVNPGEDLDGDGVPFDVDDFDGLDNDLNGVIDDLIGYDFVDNARDAYNDGTLIEDGDDPDSDPSDFILDGHGTHTNGIMTALGNNGYGMAGCNWSSKLMCLRAGYYPNDGTLGGMQTIALLRCFRYAIDMGAKVINMSYGSSYPDPDENDACQDAWAAGVLLVGGAGNDDVSSRFYPANFNHVISVAATDENDYKAYFSNYGNWIELSAPGVSIYSTIPIDSFASWDGTSMASPVAAGCGALVRAYFPDSSNHWVYNRLLDSADPIDSLNPGYEDKLGRGRVNVFRAIGQVIYPELSFVRYENSDIDGNLDGRVDPGETGEIILSFANEPGWMMGTGATLHLTTADTTVEIITGDVDFPDIAPGDTARNDSAPIRFRMLSDMPAHKARFRWRLTTEQGTVNYGYITFMIGRPDILVYNGSETDTTNISYYNTALLTNRLVYDIWNKNQGYISQEELNKYRTVIWFTGTIRDTSITETELSLITNFYNEGNKVLILSGENIGEDMGGTSLFSDIIHAEHTVDDVGRVILSGIEGDPVTDSVRIVLSGGAYSPDTPSGCTPTGDAVGILTYEGDASGSFAATRYVDTALSNTVFYLGFGIECIHNELPPFTPRWMFVRKMLEFVGYDFSEIKEVDFPMFPSSPVITAYPNPFNSTVSIRFYSTGNSPSLSIYNITGEKVASLPVIPSSGWQTVSWNAAGSPTGVYLAILKDKMESRTRKLVYIK